MQVQFAPRRSGTSTICSSGGGRVAESGIWGNLARPGGGPPFGRPRMGGRGQFFEARVQAICRERLGRQNLPKKKVVISAAFPYFGHQSHRKVLGQTVFEDIKVSYSEGDHSIILSTQNLLQGIYYLNISDGINNFRKPLVLIKK